MHLEYLANMGVVASMSVSLIDDDRLWGLIACHHYAGPHRPSFTDRAVAEFLDRTASVLLGSKAGAGSAAAVLDVAERQGGSSRRRRRRRPPSWSTSSCTQAKSRQTLC